jgi:nitroimidazol reductase NimA-like FMN-containing flavoprotein (pyridoxamine 5'-phosphate oxidase superfamily)
VSALPHKKKPGTADVPERLRALNASQLHAVLCTVGGEAPYASIVAYALTPDLRGLLFATPRATTKYRNILENKNVSLLIDTRSNTGEDYMGAEAVTITGTARPLRKGAHRDELSRVMIRKHPGLAKFVRAEGTALVLVEIKNCLHVTEFQSVTRWRP